MDEIEVKAKEVVSTHDGISELKKQKEKEEASKKKAHYGEQEKGKKKKRKEARTKKKRDEDCQDDKNELGRRGQYRDTRNKPNMKMGETVRRRCGGAEGTPKSRKKEGK